MNPEYFSITFDTEGYDSEICMAMLSDLPFEAFHEDGHQIIGYILRHDITRDLLERIEAHKDIWFKEYRMEQVADQNWNAVWESSFNPVAVDDYCFIRAEFHKPVQGKFKHIVTISPKMAFGTGHHATTYMMLQAMSKLDFTGRRVFDFGCGTGILAVVAALEGAVEVYGVDIQPEAIENSIEHAQMNGVGEVCHFFQGGIDQVPAGPYDIILANINRNVILAHLPDLHGLLQPHGFLLLSGIMYDDVERITEELTVLGFRILGHQEKDQWVQMTGKKGVKDKG